ncbi:glycosyltransferase family 4 protein [Mucilaginibacter sp. ZT4R22]|uniref:Glycosyltransferase family 4 protein n=1 Tax=Mucilaginibacter pankratovii TaxID=2772110 RepID=A0ABR7WNS0_9SPHI|nr:glycosyltransferase family 4 protein [Mucilaginibacter pankratovii]MBD1363973.1 glycosyltransferase family 4 protein [Mucilaginibacter pankratovii]
MTVGLVTPYFPDEHTKDSGIANHCLLLARGIAATGNKVVVLHIRPQYKNERDNYQEYKIGELITVITHKAKLPPAFTKLLKSKWAVIDFALKVSCMLLTAKVLNAAIRKHSIDVVETSSYFSLCYFQLYKRNTVPIAVRVSTTFSQIMNDHYPFKSRGMDLIARMEIAFIKKSKHLITHAQNHALELEQLFGINHSRFQIIPHGVTLPASAPAKTVKAGPVQVLFVGRLEYRKGIDVLLAAIPLVLKAKPNVQFNIIGADTGDEYQNRFIADTDLTILQKVTFRGKVSDEHLQQAYRDCDIFVAPSRYESFGLIFIEAMSYGKPVIGCDAGGMPEIITNNYNGLFAITGDAQSLADKLILLIEDAGLRDELGENALETVREKFTVTQLAASSLNYYQKIISNTW